MMPKINTRVQSQRAHLHKRMVSLSLLLLISIQSYTIHAYLSHIRTSTIIHHSSFKQLSLASNDNNNDNINDNLLTYKEASDQPKFGVKKLETNKLISSQLKTTSSSSINPSDKTKTSATFGSLTIDDLRKKMIKIDNNDTFKPLPVRTEDLNGINPFIPLLSSIIPFIFAYLGFQLSAYLTAHFAVGFLASDIYTLQRIAIVVRNIVVGISTLATAFSTIIGFGLLALGVTVGVGVIKGELDPTKKDVDVKDLK